MNTINCNICKRPVLDQEVDHKEGIAHCFGCNHYFPIEERSKRKREEILIPNGTDVLRLRLLKDELQIKIRWFRNYKPWRSFFGANPKNSTFQLFVLIAYFFNRTEIEVNQRYIRIEHKPVDLLPMAFYSKSYVKQFFVRKLTGQWWVDAGFAEYGLFALLRTGEEKLLLWDMKRTTLLFIEQEIERVLKIEDQEVS
jgi:hypothetical protein